MYILTQKKDEFIYPITHNLGSKKLKIAVFDDTNSKEIKADIRVVDENCVEISFNNPIEGDKYHVGIKAFVNT